MQDQKLYLMYLVSNCSIRLILVSTRGSIFFFSILANLRKQEIKFTLFTTISYESLTANIKRALNENGDEDIRNCVVFLGNVPQRQMGALYEICDLMINPSLCESFGFSMIEAMGHGLPIVAADRAVNREICGEGALYYPAENAVVGAETVIKALEPETLARLKKEGLRQMNSYDWSWDRNAREFVQMLRDLLNDC